MRRTIAFAGMLLLALTASGSAAPKGGGNAGGASEMSPGDQMKDHGGPTSGSKGASEYSPGDRMKDSNATTGRGASEFAPGDRMNDARKKKHWQNSQIPGLTKEAAGRGSLPGLKIFCQTRTSAYQRRRDQP